MARAARGPAGLIACSRPCGGGAFVNDRAIRVSEAVLCLNDLAEAAWWAFAGGLLEWMAQFWPARSMGG